MLVRSLTLKYGKTPQMRREKRSPKIRILSGAWGKDLFIRFEIAIYILYRYFRRMSNANSISLEISCRESCAFLEFRFGVIYKTIVEWGRKWYWSRAWMMIRIFNGFITVCVCEYKEDGVFFFSRLTDTIKVLDSKLRWD